MEKYIIVTSGSDLKINTVRDVFARGELVGTQPVPGLNIYNESIKGVPLDNSDLPEQPVNSAKECSQKRTEIVKSNCTLSYSLLVSIENGLEVDVENKTAVDVCYVTIEDQEGNQTSCKSSFEFPIEWKYYEEALNKHRMKKLNNENKLGISVTVGEIFEDIFGVPKNNWMDKLCDLPYDRSIQIKDALGRCKREYERTINFRTLEKSIIEVPNFPKEGVLFQDMSGILKSGDLLKILSFESVQKLKSSLPNLVNNRHVGINKIVGLDSRGYIYGIMLSLELDVGFVMARKPGKTPGKFESIDYGTEYSKASIEIMEGIIDKGDNVLIVDDLIATGGSLWAACELIKRFGGNPVACFTVLKVDGLFEQAKSNVGIPIVTLF